MLTVALDNDLDAAGQSSLEQDISQFSLRSGMQMDFRLLQQYDGSFRYVGKKHQDGEDLGDSEADIRQEDIGRGGGSSYAHSK